MRSGRNSDSFVISGPGKLEMQVDLAKEALPELESADRALRRRTGSIRGVRVERKAFAIAVHYREVPSTGAVARVEEIVDETLAEHPKLRKQTGKKIFELQPDIEWDKGRAVLWLADALGLDVSRVKLIYIGDDVTDEDAFRALKDVDGIGIQVGDSDSSTDADYHLQNCEEVLAFLLSLVANKKVWYTWRTLTWQPLNGASRR